LLSLYFLNYFMGKAGLIGTDDINNGETLLLEDVLDNGEDLPMTTTEIYSNRTEEIEDKKDPPVNLNDDFPDLGDFD